jgi:hypothetical protein
MLQRQWNSLQPRQQRCTQVRARAPGSRPKTVCSSAPRPSLCAHARSPCRQPQAGSVAARFSPCPQLPGSVPTMADVLQQRSSKWEQSSQGARRPIGLRPRCVFSAEAKQQPHSSAAQKLRCQQCAHDCLRCCQRVLCCAVPCCAVAQGDSKAAKGVVLFMHGFAQGPNAYYENLQGLADAGFLVVAPLPPFGVTPSGQQVCLSSYTLQTVGFKHGMLSVPTHTS